MKMNKRLIAAAIAGAVVITAYKCPIKYLTGFSCPGCGMTRALIMMFYDMKGAFYMHPLFPAAAASIPAAFIKKYRVFLKEHSEHFTQIAVFLLIAVYIWRMLVVYPDAPMEYQEKNLMKILLKLGGMFSA